MWHSVRKAIIGLTLNGGPVLIVANSEAGSVFPPPHHRVITKANGAHVTLAVSPPLHHVITEADGAHHTSAVPWGVGGSCAQNNGIYPITHAPFDRPEKWVEAHNYYRACHGSPPVQWDPTLVAYAQRWAETILQHCSSVMDLVHYREAGDPKDHHPHDPETYKSEVPKQGENLAFYDGPITVLPAAFQPAAYTPEVVSVEGWYREVDTDCGGGHLPGCNGMLNHYTAMIWKTVRRLGCYSAVRGGFMVVSCRYSTAVPDDGLGCELPNIGGCEAKGPDPPVPALVTGGRCEPMVGSTIPAVALGRGSPGSPAPHLALPLPQLKAVVGSAWAKVSGALTQLRSGRLYQDSPHCHPQRQRGDVYRPHRGSLG